MLIVIEKKTQTYAYGESDVDKLTVTQAEKVVHNETTNGSNETDKQIFLNSSLSTSSSGMEFICVSRFFATLWKLLFNATLRFNHVFERKKPSNINDQIMR